MLRMVLVFLSMVLISLTHAHAGTIQPGTYTFAAEGYGGDATITPVQGMQGVFSLTAETFNASNGNMCSYSGTCITQGTSLLCTTPEAPEAIVKVQLVTNGIELSGEDTSYFCGSAVFFMGKYLSKTKNVATEASIKIEVFEFLGYLEEPFLCGPLHADEHLDKYACLFFRSTDASQRDVHMWYEYALPIKPTQRADLLVAYYASAQGNVYYSSIANPRPAPIYKDEAVFLGEDAEAPEGGVFMFKDSVGDQLYLNCWEDFCSNLLQYKGKRMEITYQDRYYYHEGGEGFVEDSFVLSYKLLPQ